MQAVLGVPLSSASPGVFLERQPEARSWIHSLSPPMAMMPLSLLNDALFLEGRPSQQQIPRAKKGPQGLFSLDGPIFECANADFFFWIYEYLGLK